MAWTANHSLGITLQQYQEAYARATALEIAVLARDSQALAQVEARGIVASVCRSAVEGIAGSLGLFYETLQTDVLKGQEKKVYLAAAEAGQKSMLEKYEEDRKSHGLSYRGGDPGNDKRYTGILGQLLKSPDAFFNINGDVIGLVSMAKLYNNAPQWYRLNFGAGPIGTPSIPKWNIPYFDKDISGPDLSTFRRAPSFMIPAGVWSSTAAPTSQSFFAAGGKSDGGPAFYPIKYGRESKSQKGLSDGGRLNVGHVQMSKGIVGGRFLDHGINSFNRKLGWGMEALTMEWIKHASESSRGGRARGVMNSQNQSLLVAQHNSVAQAAISHSNSNSINYKNAVVRAIVNANG